MSWNASRARARIEEFAANVPQIVAESYEDAYMPRYLEEAEQRRKSSIPVTRPLVNLAHTSAVIVDTVHVYANLVNYEEYKLDEGEESERAHARALNFLHLHYGACDRVIEDLTAQRVDFHGPRVHAVVIEPTGGAAQLDRVLAGLELAQQMILLSDLANEEIAERGYTARFRVGIDAGTCVAINSGNGVEQEPLFLGGSANHAAKLAEGSAPGIYLSDRVRSILRLPVVGGLTEERLGQFTSDSIFEIVDSMSGASRSGLVRTRAQNLLEEWRRELDQQKAGTGGASRFKFHYQQPPLSQIDYSRLSPANSIRMPMISLFADLDGYTRYIDHATQTGTIDKAVRALHVIRNELCSVLEKDFGGRKVRFIGDCIHGVAAEGSAVSVDTAGSIREAVKCAGGFQSSFEICKEFLPNTDTLGLAVGLELGPTPVSRVGVRGERSVRLASSVATASSEMRQKACNGRQTAIGEGVQDQALADVNRLFPAGVADDLTYSDAEMMLVDEMPAPAVAASTTTRAHAGS